jgi:hypothetical protein
MLKATSTITQNLKERSGRFSIRVMSTGQPELPNKKNHGTATPPVIFAVGPEYDMTLPTALWYIFDIRSGKL